MAMTMKERRLRANSNFEIVDTDPLHLATKRHHSRVQPPSHSGPSTESLVITTNIPPITVRFNGQVRSYTRHEIARDLKMHPSTISMLFSGRRNLTLNMALKFRAYFQVSLDYLVDTLMPQSRWLVQQETNKQRSEILAEQAELVEQANLGMEVLGIVESESESGD